jgi:hypothetical protein
MKISIYKETRESKNIVGDQIIVKTSEWFRIKYDLPESVRLSGAYQSLLRAEQNISDTDKQCVLRRATEVWNYAICNLEAQGYELVETVEL